MDGRHVTVGALLLAGAWCATAAQHNGALVGLINDYRASAPHCGGARVAMAGPLAPVAALANAPAPAGGRLQEALQAAGYSASRTLAITLTGPDDAAAAMRLLTEYYCRELSSPHSSREHLDDLLDAGVRQPPGGASLTRGCRCALS